MQIKIYKIIFIIDFTNTLRCYSLKNGWNGIFRQISINKTQKIINGDCARCCCSKFLGDISAVNNGWRTTLQLQVMSYESAFSLETSDIITDNKDLFFSNNKNQFFQLISNLAVSIGK